MGSHNLSVWPACSVLDLYRIWEIGKSVSFQAERILIMSFARYYIQLKYGDKSWEANDIA